ncbi:MAG: pentapeptide repeat-containing protein [Deltaproteobacteria bacterium]|nr:pentapeptide repeat-containing protein [Deltaproteobacteria bacterium]
MAGIVLLLLAGFVLLDLPPALSQEAKKTETEKPWTGEWPGGGVMTRAELDKVLQAHSLWRQSNKKEGEQANLSGAKLYNVNLYHVNLDNVNLSKADLRNANLRFTRLENTNLNGANLEGTNLSWARLINTDLSGADMSGTDLSYAIFIPKGGSLSNTVGWHSVSGLSTLRDYRGLGFQSSKTSRGLMELRETLKKEGSRDREREVTFAFNHNRRLLLEEDGFMGKMESLFQLVCFEWTCGYGMNPGRPLQILGLGLLVFALPLYLSLRYALLES